MEPVVKAKRMLKSEIVIKKMVVFGLSPLIGQSCQFSYTVLAFSDRHTLNSYIAWHQ